MYGFTKKKSGKTGVSRAALLLLIAVMTLSLAAGCGTPPGGGGQGGAVGAPDGGGQVAEGGAAGQDIALKLWGAQDEQELLKEMSEAFAQAHPESKYTFEYGVVSEADLRTIFSQDPSTAADVFMFANDQLRDMASSGSLYEVTRNKADIVARNLPGSVEASTYEDALYAYPMTADNGYFMYYDKSVISDEQAGSIEGILAAANAANKKFFMDISNGWYISSFFLGAGCSFGLTDDGKQTCDFNNENGLLAAEAVKALTADPAFMTGDDTTLVGGIGSTIAAGVTGTWNADSIQKALGDNYAATKLPTYDAGGKTVQMGSFGGYKLVGVNSLTKFPEAAMDLADWLTNEENQMKRFEARIFGPSNIAAAESEEVKANVALSALAMQNQFAVPQNDVLNNYWGPSEAFGTAMEAKDYSKPLQQLLDEMVTQIESTTSST